MKDSEVKALLPDYLESNLPAEQMCEVEARIFRLSHMSGRTGLS